ncbi:MAG TPA: PIN domain-containing protein [Holophaga sp.]|nr:PIN domain-containing protein [Holophaga sp.]
MSGARILDASAVLALAAEEAGASRVRDLLLEGGCAITTVDLAEVATQMILRGGKPERAERFCLSLGMEVLEVDQALAFQAAALALETRPLGLSLGGRLCLAAAMREAGTAVTADQVWVRVPGVQVEVIR